MNTRIDMHHIKDHEVAMKSASKSAAASTTSLEKVRVRTLCKYYMCTYVHGVATISRLLKIVGLFCRISSLL